MNGLNKDHLKGISRTMPDLKITSKEHLLIRQADQNPAKRRELLARFWLSRLEKEDPIARIGYALWSKDSNALARAIRKGDKRYWDHNGYVYWEGMARTTVINIAAGLERAGFKGTFQEQRRKIEEVGVEVAKEHIRAVRRNYRDKKGTVPGLLSLKQVARYHIRAFEKFDIRSDFYGGTWFKSIPDSWELEAYGGLYCHDCDPKPAP